MKEFYLDQHSSICESRYMKDDNPWINFCQENVQDFLFYLKGNFFLVKYHMCLETGCKYDWLIMLIDSIIKNNKIYDRYQVNKSVDLDKDLKDWRIRNIPLRKTFREVNYIYQDGAGKEYCITTAIPYEEAIIRQEVKDDNYKIAMQYLKDTQQEHLMERLSNLAYDNTIHNYYDINVVKETEHLVKQINKLCEQ